MSNMAMAGDNEIEDYPNYPAYVQVRILNALIKAAQSHRKAWKIGTSVVDGDDCYEVWSHDRPGVAGPYFVKPHNDGSKGGFVYAGHTKEPEPTVWLRCTCPAGEHSLPCWHAARVHLRLSREHRARLRKGGGDNYDISSEDGTC
ncbi:MAG TPA: SWIM zinc finger family protein [Candidatus Paceibacterota bacterium]